MWLLLHYNWITSPSLLNSSKNIMHIVGAMRFFLRKYFSAVLNLIFSSLILWSKPPKISSKLSGSYSSSLYDSLIRFWQPLKINNTQIFYIKRTWKAIENKAMAMTNSWLKNWNKLINSRFFRTHSLTRGIFPWKPCISIYSETGW